MDWRSLRRSRSETALRLADGTCRASAEGRKTELLGCRAGASHSRRQAMVMLDGGGRPRAVIETVELTQRRFPEVICLCLREGEENRTCAVRRDTRPYFTPLGQFTPDMLLWCERFRVVEISEAHSGLPASCMCERYDLGATWVAREHADSTETGSEHARPGFGERRIGTLWPP
jgi:uncharacterized protein YhfF